MLLVPATPFPALAYLGSEAGIHFALVTPSQRQWQLETPSLRTLNQCHPSLPQQRSYVRLSTHERGILTVLEQTSTSILRTEGWVLNGSLLAQYTRSHNKLITRSMTVVYTIGKRLMTTECQTPFVVRLMFIWTAAKSRKLSRVTR